MGFLAGLFWGAIVGGVAVFVSSFALERQELSLPQPSASAVEVPGGSEFDQARPESEPVLPTQETAPEAAVVETVEAPEETVEDPPALDTAALAEPETVVDAPAALGDAPEPVEEQSDIATDTAVEEALAEELEAPEAPADAPEAVDEPAAPEAVEEADQTDLAATAPANDQQPAAEAANEPALAALPETDTAADQPDTETLPEVTTGDTTPSLVQPEITEEQSLPDAGQDTEIAAIGESPEAPRLPQVTEEPSLPQATPNPEPSVQAEATPEPAPEPEVASEPDQTDGDTAFIGGSDGAASVRVDGGSSFLEQVDALETQNGTLELQTETTDSDAAQQSSGTSLPTVRRAGVATESSPSDAPEEVVEEEVTEETKDGPALQRFASAFENPDGSPVISVVLLHVGTQPLGSDVLLALPAHVSFAVDANAANVAGTAQAYRDAGREVVLVPSLPEGAAPQDVEQAMQVNLSKVPEAVAIMDISGSNFQSDRSAVRQVVDVVSDTGHGLITFPRGLNTAHQEAQRANVPTGLIFRDVDGDNESQEEIRRALDRAAFRARQNEGVILVGTTSDTTIAAIVEWALGNRAASVSIAPISTALDAATGG